VVRAGRLALGAAAAVGAAALGGFLVLRPDREASGPLFGPGPSPLRPVPERRTVTAPDGTRIAVQLHGPPGAPQVVLCHGWTNTSRVWDDVVALVDDDLRVVTWDQPGHGDSDPPPERRYLMDAHGDALDAVLDQALAAGPVVVAGHSLGGMTVLNFARRHPDTLGERVGGLLLLSTMARLPIALGGAARAVDQLSHASRWALDNGGRALARASVERTAGLTRALTRRVALGRDATAAQVDATARLFVTADPDVLAGLTLPILSLDEDAALERIGVPTVVVTGEDDLLTPPAYGWHLARRIPGAELRLLPRVGHMTPLESAPLVAELLLRLAGVED
jgi:pimeloyl-ACP methyl ester carboxylesterase